MEDQRNWSDASFKTYCTPLELPKPVELRDGDRIQQAVCIRLLGDAPPAAPGVYLSAGPVRLHTDHDPSGTVPDLGVYFSGVREAIGFPFHHLRVDVDTTADDLEARLAAASAAAERLSASLFVSAMIGDASRLADCASSLNAPVSHWLVLREDGLATSEYALEAFRQSVDTGASVGGGSNAYFTEINRTPPPPRGTEFTCFSVNPQVHAFDELSMMETLPMHAVLVENARRIAGGRPVAVSPVTLRPRFNPEARFAGSFQPDTGFDRRQDSPFGAAWTAGSFIYLCEAGAGMVSYHDVSTLDEPIAALLRRILTWRGAPTRRVTSSDPERVIAVGVGSAPHSLLIVNLTPQEQKAVADNHKPVILPPYGYTVLEEGL